MRAHLSPALKDTASLHLMLNIAFAYCLKGDTDKASYDTAWQYLNQVSKVNNQAFHDQRIAGLCALISSKVLKKKGDIDRSRNYAIQAVGLLKQAGDSLDWSCALVHEAGYYSYDELTEDSIRISLYRRALPVLDSLGSKEMQSHTRELMADCILQQYGGKDALPLLFSALKIEQTLPGADLRNVYRLLGECYNDLGDPQTALVYGYKAVRLEEAAPKKEEGLTSAYNHVGMIYNYIEDYENAILFFRKSMYTAIERKDPGDTRLVGLNLINTLIRAGKYHSALDTLNWLVAKVPPTSMFDTILQDRVYASIYWHIDQPASNTPYGNELEKLYSRTDPTSLERLYLLVGLTSYYMSLKKYEQLKAAATEVAKLGDRWEFTQITEDGWSFYFKADSAKGDWRAAAKDYQRYSRLKDSFNEINHSRQMAGFKVAFDAETMDKDIEHLKENQRLNQMKLHQAAIARNAIIGGAVILLILLGVAANRYMLKQRSNRQLNRLLGEKEWLVKEIHHRVKNNLQLAMSLLNTQSFYIDNEKAQEAIQQSRNRMYAMSLIHQRLYQVDSLETIDMSQYIPELVNYIRDLVEEKQHIDFDLHIQPLRLDVSQAVPLGLILNEAITNSVKHAFNGRDKGRITIKLEMEQNTSRAQLLIADNGTGLPAGFDSSATTSMGMQLINTLVVQIDGTLHILNQGGLSLVISFITSIPFIP